MLKCKLAYTARGPRPHRRRPERPDYRDRVTAEAAARPQSGVHREPSARRLGGAGPAGAQAACSLHLSRSTLAALGGALPAPLIHAQYDLSMTSELRHGSATVQRRLSARPLARGHASSAVRGGRASEILLVQPEEGALGGI